MRASLPPTPLASRRPQRAEVRHTAVDQPEARTDSAHLPGSPVMPRYRAWPVRPPWSAGAPDSVWRSCPFGKPAVGPRRGSHRLLPLPLQLRDELLEILPLAQGIEIGVFLHERHVLVALAHSIPEELHRHV